MEFGASSRLAHLSHSYRPPDIVQAVHIQHFSLLHHFNFSSVSLLPHNLAYCIHGISPLRHTQCLQLRRREGSCDFRGTDCLGVVARIEQSVSMFQDNRLLYFIQTHFASQSPIHFPMQPKSEVRLIRVPEISPLTNDRHQGLANRLTSQRRIGEAKKRYQALNRICPQKEGRKRGSTRLGAPRWCDTWPHLTQCSRIYPT